MEKKCFCCDNTTTMKLDDLHTSNWCAARIGKGKAIYSCPLHIKEFMKKLQEEMLRLITVDGGK